MKKGCKHEWKVSAERPDGYLVCTKCNREMKCKHSWESTNVPGVLDSEYLHCTECGKTKNMSQRFIEQEEREGMFKFITYLETELREAAQTLILELIQKKYVPNKEESLKLLSTLSNEKLETMVKDRKEELEVLRRSDYGLRYLRIALLESEINNIFYTMGTRK